MAEPITVKVAINAPQHTGLSAPLDYLSECKLPPGTLVSVPLGKREVPGIVWHGEGAPDIGLTLRAVSNALDALPPLGASWRALVDFAAAYYQRSTGEIALSVLPPELRKLDNAQLANRIKKLHKALSTAAQPAPATAAPALTAEQADALMQIAALAAQDVPATLLLHGVTGSGKT